MKRIYLVEDHPVMRAGYASLISHEPDLELCGEAGSAEEAIAAVQDLQPDIVVADLSLPGVSGIEFVERLSALGACGAILVVSSHDEALYAERALAAGARGYLMKDEAAEHFVRAVRRVHDGHVYVSKRVGDWLVEGRAWHRSPATVRLTDRETEVFEHFGRGQTTVEIAEQLGLSAKTVESHRGNIKKKLGLSHVAEFSRQAVLYVEHLASQGTSA